MWKKQYTFYVAVDDPFETLECTSECTEQSPYRYTRGYIWGYT